MDTPRFGTFWHGSELTPYEAACLGSFANRGYGVDLFSFSPVDGLPDRVVNHDAREIIDDAALNGFIVEGRPNIAHFSDYFRYKLFLVSDRVWIDADMVCLRPIQRDLPGNLVVREQSDSLNNAIMRIRSDDPALPAVIRDVEGLIGRPIGWGDTGPKLLTRHFGQDLLSIAEPPERFYPVHFTEFWKVFHPDFNDECQGFCRNAETLHLWNNLVVRAGIWKKFGPPKGSFLADAFEQAGCLSFFSELYPADVMVRLLENYLARDGADLGLKRIGRLLVSGMRNTRRRRLDGDKTSFLYHLPSMSRSFGAN